MKNTKMIKIVAVIGSMSALVLSLGFGCGLGFAPTSEVLDQLQQGAGGGVLGGNTDGLDIKPGAASYGTSIYTNYYNSLLNILNLDPTVNGQTNNVRNEFNRQREALSDTGRATNISAPLLFSSMTLAAAACLDRINFENQAANAGARLFFNEINLGAGPNNNVTPENLRAVINRLARAFYGDNQSPEEEAILIADVQNSMNLDNANNATETREAMLYLCTAMASSTLGLQQ